MPEAHARALGAEIVNLPNAITAARLCAVPVAVWLTLRDQLGGSFFVFAAAGVSDAVDGWLARRHGGSALGAVLDPLADKALLVSMLIALGLTGALPGWLVGLAVGRDVLIVAGLSAMWLLRRPVRMRPYAISKLNTAMQLLLVGVTLLLHGFAIEAGPVLPALIWLAAATTVLSGAAYLRAAALGRLG